MESKSAKGIKTTEFWVAALSPIVTMLIGALMPEHQQALVAQVGSVLTSIGYLLSRSMVKSKALDADTASAMADAAAAYVESKKS